MYLTATYLYVYLNSSHTVTFTFRHIFGKGMNPLISQISVKQYRYFYKMLAFALKKNREDCFDVKQRNKPANFWKWWEIFIEKSRKRGRICRSGRIFIHTYDLIAMETLFPHPGMGLVVSAFSPLVLLPRDLRQIQITNQKYRTLCYFG